MRIVETDNYGGDHPDESFLLGSMSNKAARAITQEINKHYCGPDSSRYWKVVENDYELKPGFEP